MRASSTINSKFFRYMVMYLYVYMINDEYIFSDYNWTEEVGHIHMDYLFMVVYILF